MTNNSCPCGISQVDCDYHRVGMSVVIDGVRTEVVSLPYSIAVKLSNVVEIYYGKHNHTLTNCHSIVITDYSSWYICVTGITPDNIRYDVYFPK